MLVTANDPIAQFLSSLFTWSLDAYSSYLDQFYNNFFDFIFTIALVKIFFMILFQIFPFIESIANTIFIPFRALHNMAHSHKAKQINAKAASKRLNLATDEGIPSNARLFLPKLVGRVSLRVNALNREYASLTYLGYENLSYKQAMAFALAPEKYAYIILIIDLLLIPLAQQSTLFLVAHMYIYFGSILMLFPSNADYEYLYNTLMNNSTVNPFYWIHGLIIFIVLSYIQYQFYADINYPPYWYIDTIRFALAWTAFYYLLLIAILRFTGPDHTLKAPLDSYETTKLQYGLNENNSLSQQTNKNQQIDNETLNDFILIEEK